MITIKRLLFGLVLFCSINNQIGFGQKINDLKLDNKLSILNDKAFFLFPTAAVNSSRSSDIMSADPNINQETRVVLDIDEMRLVFFAQELFRTGDTNLFENVSKEKNDLGFKRKITTNNDQILAILSTPSIFDSTQNAILVNSMMVKTQDNSIFRIDAYINPEAFKFKDEFIKLTDQVFKSVSKGTRINDKSAKVQTLKIFRTKKAFDFTLPENYCIIIDQKYDFQVFNFHKYTNYNDSNWISLTIYTGNHPSYFYEDYDFDINSSKKVTNNFLNKNVNWLTFYNTEKKIYLKEQQIPCDNIKEGLIVHIAMLSNSSTSIDELTKIVETIKIKSE